MWDRLSMPCQRVFVVRLRRGFAATLARRQSSHTRSVVGPSQYTHAVQMMVMGVWIFGGGACCQMVAATVMDVVAL